MRRLLFCFLFAAVFLISGCKKEGCTNPDATNYDSKADKDDGSCIVDYTANLVGTYVGLLVDAETDGSAEYPYYNEPVIISKVDNNHVRITPGAGGIADPFTATVEKLANGNYSLSIAYQVNSNGNTIIGYFITGISANGAYDVSTRTLRYGITISNYDLIEAFEGTKL